MSDTKYDSIIIGGGPAGSTLATRLAQAGHRVLVLEQERFPRFHIGESLLPCSMPLFERLGVRHKLDQAGFLPKYAAEFVTGDAALYRRYAFADGVVDGPPSAYEVDRSEFDAVLLRHAAESGAEVIQGVRVTHFSIDAHRGVEVTVREVPEAGAQASDGAGPRGTERRFFGEILVDASGQRALIGSELGMKEMDPYLKNFAVFSHYQGAERHSGEREGDIAVVLVPEGWWWVIPLAKDRTSVGLVAPKRALGGRKPDEAYFLEKIENTPYLKKRFGGATRVAPVRTVSDYSFVCRRLCGDRWLLVGDAAAFIDPVFSTGVYLGMQGAFHAAEAISSALARRSFGRRSFAAYERWLSRAVGVYRDFVKGFYSPEFAEALMHPSDRLQLRQAVTSLLAGRGVGCFEVTWRVWVFKTLARANRRLNLMPRLPGRREAYQAFSQGVASTR